ncbi:MAG: redoxin domain-containing protein, partial [Phycisphaerales bacterium]
TLPILLKGDLITVQDGSVGRTIRSEMWPADEPQFEKVVELALKYGQREYSCPVRVELMRQQGGNPIGSYWFCAYLSGRLPWGAGGRIFEIVNLDQQMEFRAVGDGTDKRDAVLGVDINGDGRIDPAESGGEQFHLYEPFKIGSKTYRVREVDPYSPRVVFLEVKPGQLFGHKAKMDIQTEVQEEFNNDAENTHSDLESEAVLESSGFKATPLNGVTVELVGLTRLPAEGQPRWRPDGSVLDEPVIERLVAKQDPSVDPNHADFNYYAMMASISEAAGGERRECKWDFEQTDGYPHRLGSITVEPDVKARTRIHAVGIRFPKDVAAMSFKLGISGSWEPLLTFEDYGSFAADDDRIVLRQVYEAHGLLAGAPLEDGHYFNAAHNILDRDVRIVAVDNNGGEHVCTKPYGTSTRANQVQGVYGFRNLNKKDVQEYRVEVRPYTWIEFEDVSLQPGQEAVDLANAEKAKKDAEIERWLGQGQTRRIRQLILKVRNCGTIHEHCESQVQAIAAVPELASIGEPAVSELVDEMQRKEPWSLPRSLLPFKLRAIGHRQAVPVLIDALDKSKYRGDYGIYVRDNDLAKFMLDDQYREPDESDRQSHAIVLGCPVIEITAALEKITGHTEGHEHFYPGRDQLVRQVADRWRSWWRQNGDREAAADDESDDEIAGRVVDGEGKPVAGAQVALSTDNLGVQVSHGKLEPMLGNVESRIFETDSNGDFDLGKRPEGSFDLILAHDKGFALVESKDFLDSREIRLQPWGRIEGRVAQGRYAAENKIWMAGSPNSTWFLNKREYRYETKCDTGGRFVFEKVPAGWFEAGYLTRTGEMGASITCRTPFEVKAGETTKITLGGSGRPVVGNFVPPESCDKPMYFGNGLRDLITTRPDEPLPENFDRMTKREQQQWRMQWYKTEEYRQYRDAYWHDPNWRQYTFRINDDGSFRIEDVIAGKYDLTVWIEERITGAGRPEEIASYYGTIEVPQGGQSDEPLDLGELELMMHEPLRVGDAAPLFEAKTLDGGNLKPIDYRGKFVLLSIWQPVSHPEIERLWELYDTYKPGGRFEIIGLGGNDTLEEVRKYLEENPVPWPQIFIGEEFKAGIAKDYRIQGMPWIFFIGPDGTIIGTGLRGEKLESAVREALGAVSGREPGVQAGPQAAEGIICRTPGELMDRFLELARAVDPATGELFAEDVAPEVTRLLQWWGGLDRC